MRRERVQLSSFDVNVILNSIIIPLQKSRAKDRWVNFEKNFYFCGREYFRGRKGKGGEGRGGEGKWGEGKGGEGNGGEGKGEEGKVGEGKGGEGKGGEGKGGEGKGGEGKGGEGKGGETVSLQRTGSALRSLTSACFVARILLLPPPLQNKQSTYVFHFVSRQVLPEFLQRRPSTSNYSSYLKRTCLYSKN